MRKAGKKAPRPGKRSTGASKNGRAVDLVAVRQRIINLVGNNASEMVKTSIEELKKRGNLATLKFLFESVGLFPCPAGEQASAEDDSLTANLFKRLGAPENGPNRRSGTIRRVGPRQQPAM